MFSTEQKREIADAIQQILRNTEHPELPEGEITFFLHVDGAENWSWADIRNNGAVTDPKINPWNEQIVQVCQEEAEKAIQEVRGGIALAQMEEEE